MNSRKELIQRTGPVGEDHHDGGLVRTGIDFQFLADADEAGAVITLILNGGCQNFQIVKLCAGTAGKRSHILAVGLGD